MTVSIGWIRGDSKPGYHFTCDSGGPEGYGCGHKGPLHKADDFSTNWRAANTDQDIHYRTCKPDVPESIENLEFPPPDCSVCEDPLEYEDGWSCYRCCIHWDRDGTGGWVDQETRDELSGNA